jgi:hypothetical protein
MRWLSGVRAKGLGVVVSGPVARIFAGRTAEEAESKRDRYERRKGAS